MRKLVRTESEALALCAWHRPSPLARLLLSALAATFRRYNSPMLHCPTLSRLGHKQVGPRRGSNKPLPLYRQGCYLGSPRRRRTVTSEYGQGGTRMDHDRPNLPDTSGEPSVDALKSGAPFTIIQFFFLAFVLIRPLREMHGINSMEVKWQSE